MSKPFNTAIRMFNIYRKRQMKFDLIAAIVVFLVAIPLCLGVALASGAPLVSGILSGIIGGLVVGTLSGSQVSVSGPAAGMAAVVLAAITQLGDFNTFLLALMLAGMLQILIGSLRAGFIADYVPSNVIQGLLCAIGILLIVKQLPLAFTLSSTLSELKMDLLESTTGLSLKPIYELSYHINSGATIISIFSFALLIFLDKAKHPLLRAVPATVVVVILGTLCNEMFTLTNSVLTQHSPQLVNIPHEQGFLNIIKEIGGPNFSAWNNPNVYLYAVILAIVASLESLLNIKAAERMDKKHRQTSKDRELVAQGIGNLIAGLAGAIPITSVVVRTSVNIQAGGRTKLAAVLHGLFILLAVAFMPHLLNKIPLCSLATVLIYTGYKLTTPKIYKRIYHQGADRFIPFITTVVGIVSTDLLTGIILGLFVSLLYILKSNGQARLDIIQEVYPSGITNRIVLPQQTTFLNKASLVAELNSIPKNAQLIIDARYSDYIDKEIIELIQEFQHEQAPLKQISLNLIGFKEQYNIHNYIDFINVTTYDVQSALTPPEVLNILREGNLRFLSDSCIHRSLKIDIQYTAKNQHPIAVVLGCIDSRVPVESVFDMSFGDLFCVRVAGNVVNDDVLASIEYACHVVGAKLIVVLGHTRCGAIAAACDGVKQGHITQLLSKINPAIAAETQTKENRTGQNSDFTDHVTELNIANTIHDIYESSSILKLMINEKDIGIVGAIYDVNSGEVLFKDFANDIRLFCEEKESKLADKLSSILLSS